MVSHISLAIAVVVGMALAVKTSGGGKQKVIIQALKHNNHERTGDLKYVYKYRH